MKPIGWLIAGILAVIPLSYEWLIAVVGPFLAETLWQSVEAIALAQLWGFALTVFVVVPIVLACRWIWDRFN